MAPVLIEVTNQTATNVSMSNYKIWITVNVILSIIVLSGNILTILAVLIDHNLPKNLPSKFILNLAISDIIIGIALLYDAAFYIFNVLKQYQSTCLLRYSLFCSASCLSVHSLAIIAIDRYVATMYPLHYKTYMTQKMAKVLFVSGWIIGIVDGICSAFAHDWTKSPDCEKNQMVLHIYVYTIQIPLFSLCWMFLLSLYIRIWIEIERHMKQMEIKSINSITVNDRKAVKMLIMVVGCFTVMWLPYMLVVLQQTFNPVMKEFDVILYRISFIIAMSNSAVNPIIYAWRSSRFRDAFLRLLNLKIIKTVRSNSHTYVKSGKSWKTKSTTTHLEEYRIKNEIF